jgi:alpha-D-xyloside xylohydrolase
MPGQNLPGLPPISAEQSEHGIRTNMGSEVLDIVACSDSVIHVIARANAGAEQGRKPWMLDASESCPGVPFQFTHDAKTDTLKTKQLEVSFSLDRGNVSFRTIGGDTLLREGNSLPRTYEPAQVNGENTFRVTDRFSPIPTEAFYGLGQHQSGMFNYRGSTVELGTC